MRHGGRLSITQKAIPIESVSIDLISNVPIQTEFPFDSANLTQLTDEIKKDFAAMLGFISLDGDSLGVNAKNIQVEHIERGPNGMANIYLRYESL